MTDKKIDPITAGCVKEIVSEYIEQERQRVRKETLAEIKKIIEDSLNNLVEQKENRIVELESKGFTTSITKRKHQIQGVKKAISCLDRDLLSKIDGDKE